jgi:HEAT repeat protein
MWRRLGEACEELTTADEKGIRALWRELREDELLTKGCNAAVEARAESLPTLQRCYEQLSDSAISARLRRACRGQRLQPQADHEAREIAVTVVVLLSLRCAAGESGFEELVAWTARLAKRGAPAGPFAFTPAVPISPFVWFRAAAGLLPVPASHGPDGNDLYHGVLCWLAQRERQEIVAAVNDPAERALLDTLFARHGPRQGLHFVELLNWPRTQPAGAFPTPNVVIAHTPAENEPLSDPWSDLLRLSASANATARFAAVLLIERHVELGAPQPPHSAQVHRLLRRSLAHDHPAIRGLCLRAISRLSLNNPGRVVRRLGPLLNDPVGAVRVEAARASIRHQRVTRTVYDGLVAQLASAEADVRREAATAVAALGMRMARPAVLSALEALLREDNAPVVTQAARTASAFAARMTAAILRALVRQLRSTVTDVRLECLRAVQATGRRASRPSVIRATLRLFEDPSADVRREAILTYSVIQRAEDDPPTEALIQLLEDPSPDVLEAAARLTGQFGRRVLCSSIIDRIGWLLRARLTRPPRPYCSENDPVALAALVAAERLGAPAAVTSVVEGTINWILAGDRQLAEQACRTAEVLAAMDRVAVRVSALLRSTDRKDRDLCVLSLLKVRELACWPPMLDELLPLLNAERSEVRASAASALEWLGPKAGTPAILSRLEELLDDPDRDVRFQVGDALARLRP